MLDELAQNRDVSWTGKKESFTIACPLCGEAGCIVRLLAGKPWAKCSKGCKANAIVTALALPAIETTVAVPSVAKTNGHANGHSNGVADIALISRQFQGTLLTIFEEIDKSKPDYFNEPHETIHQRLLEAIDEGAIKAPKELSDSAISEDLDRAVGLYLGTRNVPAVKADAMLATLPDIFAGGIQILSGKEVFQRYKTTARNRAVIDGLLSLKELSLWSGKVEHGKTTLLRTMVMCLVRGEPFLDRSCVKSRVLYVMLDADGEELTVEEFLKLGWNPEVDDLHFLFDPVLAMRPNGFNEFYQRVLEIKPEVIVIDPFGRFEQIKDFNDYGTTYVVAKLSEFAKKVNAHIALPHHIPRGRPDDAEAGTAGLGSISIGGGVNARFVCTRKPGDVYTIKTSKGKGSGFVPFESEMVLTKDPQTGRVSIAGSYSYKDQARALKNQVFEVIERSEDPVTASQIAKELGVMRSAAGLAANMLYNDDHRIDRQGSGKKGSKYTYSKVPSHASNEPSLWNDDGR